VAVKFHPMLPVWLKQLGAAIAAKREKLDEKQFALAQRLGISRQTLSRMENGTNSYQVDRLLHVLGGLDSKPVAVILAQKFPAISKEDLEIHEQLQDLLTSAKAEYVREFLDLTHKIAFR
jgi:transcriptional regulator with XRE-family HTH domain